MSSSGGRAKKGAKTKENLLTEDEVKRMLEVCTDEEAPVMYTLAYTGMRVSELVHMNKSWIDWGPGLIRIPASQPCSEHYVCRQERKRRGKVVKPSGLWRVKVKAAARTFPILPELRPVLEKYFETHESIGEVIKGREYVWMMVRDVAKRAGVNKRIFPHVFRGSFASLLAGKDFDSLSIQGWLGWKSIKSADEYIRISPDRLRKITQEKWK